MHTAETLPGSAGVTRTFRRRQPEAPAFCPCCRRPLEPASGIVIYPEGLTLAERLYWRLLAANEGRVVPYSHFEAIATTRHVVMFRLRRKLAGSRVIRAFAGQGFMLEPLTPS